MDYQVTSDDVSVSKLRVEGWSARWRLAPLDVASGTAISTSTQSQQPWGFQHSSREFPEGLCMMEIPEVSRHHDIPRLEQVQ
jgi:hypothetical protein